MRGFVASGRESKNAASVVRGILTVVNLLLLSSGNISNAFKLRKYTHVHQVQNINNEDPATVLTDSPLGSTEYYAAEVPQSGVPVAAPLLFPLAPQQGMYCRGTSCNYRLEPVVLPVAGQLPPMPDPLWYLTPAREFCRGKSCVPFQGHPANAAADTFMLNCNQLFGWVSGGMKGKDGERSLLDVKQTFMDWCVTRVDYFEKGACEGYSDVVTMAVSSMVPNGSFGGSADVCLSLMMFLGASTSAQVSLQLVEAALPKVEKKKALFLQKEETEAEEWRDILERSGVKVRPRRCKKNEEPKNKNQKNHVSLLKQRSTKTMPIEIPSDKLPIPPYDPDPTCVKYDGQYAALRNNIFPKFYKLTDGPVEGTIVEVPARLWENCTRKFDEIIGALPQTGKMVCTLTQKWCQWQGNIAKFQMTGEEVGHPEWNFTTCDSMYQLVSFALRDHLDEIVLPNKICRNLLLSKGATNRVSKLVDDAWKISARKIGGVGAVMAIDESKQAELMKQAQEYAKNVFGKLNSQKKVFDEVNKVKMDMKEFGA